MHDGTDTFYQMLMDSKFYIEIVTWHRLEIIGAFFIYPVPVYRNTFVISERKVYHSEVSCWIKENL